MSDLQQQNQNAQITAFNGGHVVQVEGKTFYLTELQHPSQLTQIAPPRPIDPTPEQRLIKLLWLAVAGLGGLLGLLMLKNLFFPPVPVAAPAPAQPQTVIVQPPQPEKKPYHYRDCSPGGLFGWGQNCREERGWQ